MTSWQEITKNLTLNDKIFFVENNSKISYPSEANNQYFQIEDSSFWFTHRANAIVQLIKNFPPNGMIFDIGGGNGQVSHALEKQGFTTALIEPGLQGVLNAKQRGLKHLICATIDSANIPQNSLPAVGVFDVLEHIEDDIKFLTLIKNLLEFNGMIYLTVPAYQFLWSNEDKVAGHFRRYTLNNLRKLLKEAGFEIVYDTYIFSFLPIFIFLFRSLPYILHIIKKPAQQNLSRDHTIKNKFLESLVNKIFKLETNFILNKKRLLLGGSCLVAARVIKP
ncbi:MAG: methyltransferase domain-containing protein [Candidatus Omnitrophica bacterium]|nr:methyltransferase domain-containing protein [Candidatus Omnitrophota bacterium]